MQELSVLLTLAAVFAVTGAVVAEYVGADRGLGYLAEISTAAPSPALHAATGAPLMQQSAAAAPPRER